MRRHKGSILNNHLTIYQNKNKNLGEKGENTETDWLRLKKKKHLVNAWIVNERDNTWPQYRAVWVLIFD